MTIYSRFSHIQMIPPALSAVLILFLGLTGCGNKSELYLPDETNQDPISQRIALEKLKQPKKKAATPESQTDQTDQNSEKHE